MSEQYSYTWAHGSPEWAAHQRQLDEKASVDDLLFLALVNARSADEALPPHATGPEKNNSGETFTPDPCHASACAERAGAYLYQARERLKLTSHQERAEILRKEIVEAALCHLARVKEGASHERVDAAWRAQTGAIEALWSHMLEVDR
jgi:hypothetical protein